MFELVKSEVKDLTPELAKEFHELEPSPTERELNPARIKHLREKADTGRLITFQWSAVEFKGKRLRMNGQHSSAMLCGLDGAFPKNLKVHLDEYKVQDQEDLAILFRQFDDRRSSRSAGDVAGAYQGLEPALHDVPRSSAKLAIDGIAWVSRTVRKEPTNKGDGIYEMFHDVMYHPFVKWIGDIFSIKTPEMKQAPVVGAMYDTFEANEAEAKKFWHQVAAGGVEFEDNAPSTVLDSWLKAIKEGKDEDIKAAHVYQGCVYAWNAYREGKTIKDVKHDTRKNWYTVTQ